MLRTIANNNVYPVKFLEQLVFKKTVTSHQVSETDPITGQATANSKTRMISGPELVNTFANHGMTKTIFPEMLYARSDDKDASINMQQQIADTGKFSLSKMSTTGIGQVQKTLSYYLLGSGIGNDILAESQIKIDGQKADTRLS